MLQSSKLLSEYIGTCYSTKTDLLDRPTRRKTKDGNDETNPGVLKMLGMGSDENLMDYFKKVKLFRFLFPMSTILLMR
jgi:hypothetical protein